MQRFPFSGGTSYRPLAQRLGHVTEAVERQFQALDDFGRDFVGWWQQVRIVSLA